MPFHDAASKTVTPGGTRTDVPEGSKRKVTRAWLLDRFLPLRRILQERHAGVSVRRSARSSLASLVALAASAA